MVGNGYIIEFLKYNQNSTSSTIDIDSIVCKRQKKSDSYVWFH